MYIHIVLPIISTCLCVMIYNNPYYSIYIFYTSHIAEANPVDFLRLKKPTDGWQSGRMTFQPSWEPQMHGGKVAG